MNGIGLSVVLDAGMGNELSQTDGIKQSVGGEGQAGHFHKVLVEPEYSSGTSQPELELPDGNFVVTKTGEGVTNRKDQEEVVPPDPETDIHAQDTLKIRGTSDDKADDSADRIVNKSLNEEDALFQECKELISEAANRVVQRSLSKPAKPDIVTDLDAASTGEGVEQVEVVDQRRSSVTQSVEDLTVTPVLVGETTVTEINTFGNKADVNIKSNIQNLDTSDNANLETSDEGVKEWNFEEDQNSTDIKPKDKSKHSKSKVKTRDIDELERGVIESVKEHVDSKSEDTTSPITDKKSSKGNIFTNMFKFSKRKGKSQVVGELNGNNVNVKVDKSVDIPAASMTDDLSKPSTSCDAIKEEPTGIKRLNSLDSGIVVEKVCEHQPVEYAVVQKKRNASQVVDTGDNTITTLEDTEVTVNPEIGQRLAEPIYLNGDKTDEDFVYINERAVDIEGLVQADVKSTEAPPVNNEATPQIVDQTDDDKLSEDRKGMDDEMESNISSDSGTVMGTKPKKVDQVTKPEKTKLKKKSWSFQVGKKKHSPEKEDVEEGTVVSMDPNASPKESKKPKWRFGKFSFRRSQTDISASTPNLHKTGIPEESESPGNSPVGKPEKKRSKLKLIKSKKNKKKGQQQLEQSDLADEQGLEKRSSSMMDIILGDNAPRSRRSIVEEDMNLSQTDAFEGVSLSDLSLDGDVAVSSNPSGTDDQHKNKKKKSSKKDSKKKKSKLEVKVSKEHLPEINAAIAEEAIEVKTESISNPVAEVDISTPTNYLVEAGITTTNTAAEKEEESQLYANQASVEEQRKSAEETADDEYVNIVNAVKEIAENNLKEAEKEDFAQETVNDAEYAVIVKKKNTDSEAKRDSDDEDLSKTSEENIVKKSKVIAQAVILDAARIAKLTEDATEVSEQNDKDDSDEKCKEIVPTVTEGRDEKNKQVVPDIIEPPKDFKDKEVEVEMSEETIVPAQQEKAFSNLIYSDEAFQVAMSGIQNSRQEHETTEETESKHEEGAEEKESQTEEPHSVAEEEVEKSTEETNQNPKLKEETKQTSELQEATKQTPELQEETKQTSELQEATKQTPELQAATKQTPELKEEANKTSELEEENKQKPEFDEDADAYVQLQEIVLGTSAESNVDGNHMTEDVSDTMSNKNADVETDVGLNPSDFAMPEKNIVIVDLEPVHIEKIETSPVPHFQDNHQKDIRTCEIKPLIVEIVEKPMKQMIRNDIEQCKSGERKVIIMKDVGVQAPDIYIPLDIEKDFGFSDSNVSKVSKGVQVSTVDLEVEHIVMNSGAGPVSPKLSTSKKSDSTAIVPPVFF